MGSAAKQRKTQPERRALFAIVSVCFVLTGASSLILEIAWSKYLSLLLGGTIFGVSTVVAAFMAGLGLGSFVAGRMSARLTNHVRAYAVLEGTIGVFALLSPFLFTHIAVLFRILYGLSLHSFGLFLLIRFIILFILLMIPTVAMGASLPLLVEYFTRTGTKQRGYIGALYAINTLGAVLGTAFAGFYLIPKIGLARTVWIASLFDLAVCAFIFLRPFPAIAPAAIGQLEVISRSEAIPRRKWLEKMRTAFAGMSLESWTGIFIALLFGISGLLAMVYQIGWTRVLIISLGSSVYCFTIILLLYLAGLSIGAAAVARFAERTNFPLVWFGLLEGVLALATYLGTYWFAKLPALTAWAFHSSGGKACAFFLNETIIAAPIVLPPTLIMGALFPFAARAYNDFIGRTGRAVGTIYAANTLGTILGSLGAGFLLIPSFGALRTVLAASAASALIGIAAIGIAALVFASGGKILKISAAVISVIAIGGVVLRPPLVKVIDMNYGLIHILRKGYGHGIDQYFSRVPGGSAIQASSADLPSLVRFIYYREGLNATVSVASDVSDRFLIINGKSDAGTTEQDMPTQLMLGHLPMIFNPQASDVLVIGLGSGVTSHAVLTHPGVRHVDSIEIEQAVVDAASYFKDVNQDFLKDPRHRMIVEDARIWLASTDTMYDMITSEPSNPWIAGINNLFTREYFKLVYEKLRPGGVFCQWLQTYEISEQSIYVVLRTLGDVFPDCHIFNPSGYGDLLLIARKPPFQRPSPDTLFAHPAIAKDLSRIGMVDPAVMGVFYKASLRQLLKFSGNEEGIRNTNDNGYLEHTAPLELIGSILKPFTLTVRKAYFDDYHRLFYPERSDGQVLVEASRAAVNSGDLDYPVWAYEICQDRGLSESAALLRPEMEKAVRQKKIKEEIRLLIGQAEELQARNQLREALELLKKAGAIDPRDNEVLFKAALLCMDMEQQNIAEQMFGEMIRRNDRRYIYMSHIDLGIMLCRRQAFEEGLEEFKKALDLNPYLSPAYYYGSLALESLLLPDEAIEFIRGGLQYGSDEPLLLRQLAAFLEKKGSYDEALPLYRRAKRLGN